MRSRPGRVALIAVGVVMTIALVGLAFFRVERDGGWRLVPRFPIGEFFARLPSHLPWVVPFVVLTASLAMLRAIVWGRTLPQPPPPWRARFHALALGGLVHNVVPGHLGALAAAWVLSREQGTPLATGLSSFLLAKLLEFGALVLTTLGLALVAQARGSDVGALPAMLWAGGTALVVFTAALLAARRLAPPLARRLLAAGRWPRVAAALGSIASGLVAVGSPRRLLAGWALAVLPVAATALSFGLALRHVGVGPYVVGGGLLVGALTLAQVTPGVPGTVGLYYLVATATARSLGVADEDAAAVTLLSHIGGVVTHIVVGLVSALRHHDRLRELLRVGRRLPAPQVSSP